MDYFLWYPKVTTTPRRKQASGPGNDVPTSKHGDAVTIKHDDPLSSKLDCSIDADRCQVPGKDARTQDEAGDTSRQELDKNASPATTASMLLDLDKLTDAQILAVQTRAQRRRQNCSNRLM